MTDLNRILNELDETADDIIRYARGEARLDLDSETAAALREAATLIRSQFGEPSAAQLTKFHIASHHVPGGERTLCGLYIDYSAPPDPPPSAAPWCQTCVERDG